MTSWSKICRDHDIREELKRYGVDLRGSGWGICPLRNHKHVKKTPSFSVFAWGGKQRWKCWGSCGVGGDVIDLIGYMEIMGYDPHNLEMRLAAANVLEDNIKTPVNLKFEPPIAIPPFANLWFMPIHDRARNYLHHRGLSDETIDYFGLGSAIKIDKETNKPVKGRNEGLLAIPVLHGSECVGIKLRVMYPTSESGLRYFSLRHSRGGLFNFNGVNGSEDVVLLAKGELCAAAMWQAGFLACAPTSGEGGTKKEMALFKSIRSALSKAKVIVVADNDGPGRKYAPQRASLFNGIIRYPPDPYKDWDEWWLANPDECVGQTRQWIMEGQWE